MLLDKKKWYRKKRWQIPAFILIPILLVLVIGQFTPVVTAYLMKPLINMTSYTPPANIAALQSRVNMVKDLPYDPHSSANSAMDVIYPKNAGQSLPVIMWLHGGGYVGSSKEANLDYGVVLANEGYVVANIDYALAPKHQYPTPVLQANQALQFLLEHAAQYNGDMHRIFIGGDSAGAQIASQVAAVISDERLARTMQMQPAISDNQLKGVLLYCGAYDMDTVRATHSMFIATFLWAYTGAKEFESYAKIDELSTVKHITPQYPPAFITVGNKDRLEPQTQDLIQVLKRNNVETDSVLYDGTSYDLDHEYQFQMDTVPAQLTLEKAKAFLKRHSE